MDDNRLPKQAIYWEANNRKRRPGRPRKNWLDIIRRDLKETGLSWEEAQERSLDGEDWHCCVAQWVLDTGGRKASSARTLCSVVVFGYCHQRAIIYRVMAISAGECSYGWRKDETVFFNWVSFSDLTLLVGHLFSKSLCPLSDNVLERVEEEIWEELANPSLPVKWPIRWRRLWLWFSCALLGAYFYASNNFRF